MINKLIKQYEEKLKKLDKIQNEKSQMVIPNTKPDLIEKWFTKVDEEKNTIKLTPKEFIEINDELGREIVVFGYKVNLVE